MRRLLTSAAGRWRIATLCAVSLAASLITVSDAGAGVAALDADRAAGLDDLDWRPAPGTRLTGGRGSGMVLVTVTARSASAQGVDRPEGASLVHSYCPPQQSGRLYVEGRGCFRIFRDDAEDDPAASYYLEIFDVHAKAERATVARVKGRNAQDMAENVAWDPGEDRDVGEPVDITIGIPPVSGSFKAFPGMVHPWAGKHVYHSSWLSRSSSGDAPPVTRSSGGVNQWKVRPGGFVTETGAWEIWYRAGEEAAPGAGPPSAGTPTAVTPRP